MAKKVNEKTMTLIKDTMKLMAQLHQRGGVDVLLRAKIMADVEEIMGRPLTEEGIQCRLNAKGIAKIGVEFALCPRCSWGRFLLTKSNGTTEYVDCINCYVGRSMGMPGYMHYLDCLRPKAHPPEVLPSCITDGSYTTKKEEKTEVDV